MAASIASFHQTGVISLRASEGDRYDRSDEAVARKAGVEPNDGVVDVDHDFVEAAAKRFYDREPDVRLLA